MVFIDETWAKTDMTRTHGRCAKGKRLIRRALREAGEQVFAKLKSLLRKADERTVEDTWKRLGQLLDRFTPALARRVTRS